MIDIPVWVDDFLRTIRASLTDSNNVIAAQVIETLCNGVPCCAETVDKTCYNCSLCLDLRKLGPMYRETGEPYVLERGHKLLVTLIQFIRWREGPRSPTPVEQGYDYRRALAMKQQEYEEGVATL